MSNLDIYNAVRAVPTEAQKKISGGRLNGKTDINPMWRIKTLTETFGMCGVGWKYEITDKTLAQGAGDEIAAFVDINLYVFSPGVGWSEPIPGTGGSMFIAKEKSGPYTSDECYKMALTDAISVACKALGVGADVYWEKDANKYEPRENRTTETAKTVQSPVPADWVARAEAAGLRKGDTATITDAQRAELGRLCTTPTGAKDTAKVDALHQFMAQKEYASVKNILASDYDKVVDVIKNAKQEGQA